MRYEVERKFHVDDLAEIEARLAPMEAEFGEVQIEEDTYFTHPSRDFVETDEAFRMRAVGTRNRVTYKGPKIDQETKTRREIDLDLPEGEAARADWLELFQALGFEPKAVVRKHRRKAHVAWQGRRVEVSLDRIDALGTFVELELIADEAELDAAKRNIAALAENLGLTRDERRSYLRLLLDAEKAKGEG